MFSQVSVCQSFQRGSIIHDALDLTVKPPSPSPAPPSSKELGIPPASDTWWPSLETCSQLASWLLSHCSSLLRCGWYTSYWNAFMFKLINSLEDRPSLLASSGHQSTRSWQTGGTHPTGLLSCWKLRSCVSVFKQWSMSCPSTRVCTHGLTGLIQTRASI